MPREACCTLPRLRSFLCTDKFTVGIGVDCLQRIELVTHKYDICA